MGVYGSEWTTPSSFPPVLELPDLWFCEVPHDQGRPSAMSRAGWTAASEHVKEGQRRHVRKKAEHYDHRHLGALARSQHGLLPELDFDGHPEVEDARDSLTHGTLGTRSGMRF